MLKKQHILLGFLFLGMSVKPMEKSDSTNIALGVGVVAAIGIGGFRFLHSCGIRKQLCKDEGPYGSEINIYSGVDKEEEDTEIYNVIRKYDKKKSNIPYFGISDKSREKYTTMA